MNKLYTDASFDWNHTDKTKETVVRGKIAVSDGNGFERVDKVAVGKVNGLKQYINILELTALARAIELAIENNFEGTLSLWSDSRVAVSWAHSGRINPKVSTLAHATALDYLKGAIQKYNGDIQFNFIPRDANPAGHLLEDELEKEKPHAL